MPKNNEPCFRLASWNIEGRLTDFDVRGRGSTAQIIEAIKKTNADIMILLEAHSEDSIQNVGWTFALKDLGYKIYSAPYDDDLATRKDVYTNKLSMMLLTKYPVIKFETVRLGNLRNAMVCLIKPPNQKQKIRIIGVHLDDRLEKTRLSQVSDLSRYVNVSDMPTIVAGDYNAMHGDDLWPSKVLRSKISKKLSKIVLPFLSTRAIEMAKGDTLKQLEISTNLKDIDTKHRPTTTPKVRGFEWLPSIRLIQIDHIYTSKQILVKKFTVAKDNGSDHRAIIADLFVSNSD